LLAISRQQIHMPTRFGQHCGGSRRVSASAVPKPIEAQGAPPLTHSSAWAARPGSRHKIAGLPQRKIGAACRSDDPNGGTLGSAAGAG
jgi:hypothetical protein